MKGLTGYPIPLLAAALLVAMPAFANENVTYAYDALGRLVAVSTTGTVNNNQNVSANFDPAGNRTVYAVSNAANTIISILSPPAVTEGGVLVFSVNRTGNTAGAGSVNYSTATGSAISPGDFTAASGTVSFAVNETVKSISVTTINDTIAEPATEIMTVTLSAPSSGSAIAVATGTGAILDND